MPVLRGDNKDILTWGTTEQIKYTEADIQYWVNDKKEYSTLQSLLYKYQNQNQNADHLDIS